MYNIIISTLVLTAPSKLFLVLEIEDCHIYLFVNLVNDNNNNNSIFIFLKVLSLNQFYYYNMIFLLNFTYVLVY